MSAKKSTATKKSAGFSAEEKAAMKERARELKAEAQKADGEAALLAKVAEMKDDAGRTYRGVRQQFVKLGPSRGDQIAVLSGIKPGDEVVTSGVFKLRNGAAIQINNQVRPANSPAPTPKNS